MNEQNLEVESSPHTSEESERPTPDPFSFGQLVDKMVETIQAWPPEYQRSVDVHRFQQERIQGH
jgi:hypothetical protein